MAPAAAGITATGIEDGIAAGDAAGIAAAGTITSGIIITVPTVIMARTTTSGITTGTADIITAVRAAAPAARTA